MVTCWKDLTYIYILSDLIYLYYRQIMYYIIVPLETKIVPISVLIFILTFLILGVAHIVYTQEHVFKAFLRFQRHPHQNSKKVLTNISKNYLHEIVKLHITQLLSSFFI